MTRAAALAFVSAENPGVIRDADGGVYLRVRAAAARASAASAPMARGPGAAGWPGKRECPGGEVMRWDRGAAGNLVVEVRSSYAQRSDLRTSHAGAQGTYTAAI